MLEDHIQHKGSKRWKTVCTSAVLAKFGIAPSQYHYSGHTWEVVGIFRRNGFAVRSRRSKLPKSGITVGRLRARLATWGDPEGTSYVVTVPGHLILLAQDGATVVDTAPVKRDKRRVLTIHAIWKK